MAAPLKGDIVFGALTRPQMFAGVTYGYFVMNAVLTAELFLLTKSFWVILASVTIHLAGVILCMKEPQIFNIWFVRLSRTPKVKNWAAWRCNSYRP